MQFEKFEDKNNTKSKNLAEKSGGDDAPKNADGKLYKIGELALKLGVSIQTLRIYDKEGLLAPKRSDTNRRGYSELDLQRAKVILYLTRSLSINLNGVKIILKFLDKGRLKPALALELLSDMAKAAGISEEEISNNLKRYDRA